MMRYRQVQLFGAIVLILALLVAACGGEEQPVADEAGDEAAVEPTAAPATPAATEPSPTATAVEEASPAISDAATTEAVAETTLAWPRTIEHMLGEVVIEDAPERVVALEWTYVEDLLAVGVQPVGVADVEGYRTWVDVEPELAADVVDVGTRQEPSLESIAALEPDLIIAVQFRHEPIYEQLSDIAPTLVFNPYPETPEINQLQEMEQTFMSIAQAVGREAEGEEVIDGMYATFEEARATLDEQGLLSSEFVLAQAFTAQDAPQIRVFIDSSMAAEILQQIGLVNAWEGEFDQYGFNTVGVEALTQVEQAHFFYVVQDDDNVFEQQFQDNPVWNSLAFVTEGRTYPLGGDTWLFGGPLSAELVVEKVTDALIQ